ncbi:hypothetical protein NEF87_001465 [Candidatus Lokiarchaeum ossiferum]|uniref:Uncharacterized protein n=1 Tax=Candidatus Lokiarchaeum ossiferum TaxID=2951803 RepID=A0ABY6HNS8_9ARCH|nr:hypothetical protein NEF87_001465 [Candidatus Lokiarchaeum sp. B-35]
MINIAEQQRPKASQKSKSINEEKKKKEKLAKLEKLQKLEALQSQLNSLESESIDSGSEVDGLDDLESSIQQGIKGATKGEILLEVSTNDASIAAEMAALEQEVAVEAKVKVKSPYEKLLEIHDWIEAPQYGFMYSTPNKKKNKQDFESWREEWSQVLLDYAHVGLIHIIYPKRLLTEKPFNKFIDRKKAISILAEALIDKDLAKWVGDKPKKKEELRVYWKSIEEWTTLIEDWAKNNAIFDMVMVPDIRNSETEFSNLPEEDLKIIFGKIEQNHKGTVVELDDNQFGIKFKIV